MITIRTTVPMPIYTVVSFPGGRLPIRASWIQLPSPVRVNRNPSGEPRALLQDRRTGATGLTSVLPHMQADYRAVRTGAQFDKIANLLDDPDPVAAVGIEVWHMAAD